ncbi:MAG TPA: heme o synthase [Candidatus Dormibacteraeota bacterium]|nr:heme o synthase [Candidatus Dormibacteraeota bacterium]
MIKTYYDLTKPGIIYGNALTAAAGFLLAAAGHVNFGLLVATVAGTCLVIASACVFNNYIDRGIDRKMTRTRRRALVNGTISGRDALVFGTVLGLAGFAVLGFWVNAVVFVIGLVALFDYVVLYGVAKRRSVHGTLVGSIAGAAPVVAGYCAVTGRFDAGALILFLILACWQMPHFYAIAIYRFDDYKAAGLPVLPVKQGLRAAKIQIMLYVIAFIIANGLLTIFGYAGYTYLAVMSALGLAWLGFGLKGFNAADDKRWARQMFLGSLIIILALSLMLSVGSILA